MAERIVRQVRPRSKAPSLPKEIREKRVAAYARVSNDSDEQICNLKGDDMIVGGLFNIARIWFASVNNKTYLCFFAISINEL